MDLNIEIKQAVFIIFFLLVNFISFMVMLLDKFWSKRKGLKRISEGKMFFLAAAFGGFGVYAGMFLLRHKTRKWYFLIGIPLLMAQNCAILYLSYKYVNHFIR